MQPARATARSQHFAEPWTWRNNAAGASEVLTSMLWMCSVDLWTAFVVLFSLVLRRVTCHGLKKERGESSGSASVLVVQKQPSLCQ